MSFRHTSPHLKTGCGKTPICSTVTTISVVARNRKTSVRSPEVDSLAEETACAAARSIPPPQRSIFPVNWSTTSAYSGICHREVLFQIAEPASHRRLPSNSAELPTPANLKSLLTSTGSVAVKPWAMHARSNSALTPLKRAMREPARK